MRSLRPAAAVSCSERCERALRRRAFGDLSERGQCLLHPDTVVLGLVAYAHDECRDLRHPPGPAVVPRLGHLAAVARRRELVAPTGDLHGSGCDVERELATRIGLD